MNHQTQHQLDQLADMVSHNHDGMNTLAALLTCAAEHHNQFPRIDEFAHGIAGLISAIAWREQEALEQLSNITRDLTRNPFKGEPMHVPSPAELLAEKNRYLAEVLESHDLTMQDLRDLKAGLVVLSPPLATLDNSAPISPPEHSATAPQ